MDAPKKSKLKSILHTILTVGLVAVVIILLFQGCGVKKAYKSLLNMSMMDSLFYKQQQAFFTNERDSFGRHTIEQRQLILSKDQAYALLKIENDDLRRLNAQLNIRLESRHTRLQLVYTDTGRIIYDTVYVNGESIVGKYMKIPRPFIYQDAWLAIAGRVEEDGVMIDSMTNLEKIQITIGRKKMKGFKGFFTPPVPIVKIRSDNPNSVIAAANNVIVDNRKKGWDNLSLGLFVGYGVSINKNALPIVSPSFQIGVGLNYRLFPWKRYPF